MKIQPNANDFEIDRYRLDDEWVKQPDLYRRYAEALADARKLLEMRKNEATILRADTELQVRKEPEKYGLSKVTEGVIKAVVDVNTDVVAADDMVIDAKHGVAVLEAAVGALDHRKRALSDLVSLHLADYYSKPVAREDSRDAVEEMSKQKARRSQRRRRDDDD